MSLLSDPEALRRMASVLGTVLSAPQTGTTTQQNTKDSAHVSADRADRAADAGSEPPASAPTSAAVGATDGLSALLSNPAMLEQLPKILAVMKPMLAAPAAKPPASVSQKPEECRNNLLLALKPFLSPARCEAIDSIIRISHLGSVFSQLG
jgi:hypothetical protein